LGYSLVTIALSPLMSRAMVEVQSCDPSVWQTRAAQARRIASMLVGYDAELVLTYARECEEYGRRATVKTIREPSPIPDRSSRIIPLRPDRSSASKRAA